MLSSQKIVRLNRIRSSMPSQAGSSHLVTSRDGSDRVVSS